MGNLPTRKTASVGFTPQDARAAPGVNKGDYVRRTASASDASKSTYVQRPAGVTPQSVPITQVSDGQSNVGTPSKVPKRMGGGD